jgi:hypothetical protein
MVSLGIHVGATRALATAQLWSGDTMDLHDVDPGFTAPPLSSLRRIASLVADFGTAGDVIVAIVNVDHIIHSALDAICNNIFFPGIRSMLS